MSPGKTDQKRGKDSHLTLFFTYFSIFNSGPNIPVNIINFILIEIFWYSLCVPRSTV